MIKSWVRSPCVGMLEGPWGVLSPPPACFCSSDGLLLHGGCGGVHEALDHE